MKNIFRPYDLLIIILIFFNLFYINYYQVLFLFFILVIDVFFRMFYFKKPVEFSGETMILSVAAVIIFIFNYGLTANITKSLECLFIILSVSLYNMGNCWLNGKKRVELFQFLELIKISYVLIAVFLNIIFHRLPLFISLNFVLILNLSHSVIRVIANDSGVYIRKVIILPVLLFFLFVNLILVNGYFNCFNKPGYILSANIIYFGLTLLFIAMVINETCYIKYRTLFLLILIPFIFLLRYSKIILIEFYNLSIGLQFLFILVFSKTLFLVEKKAWIEIV